MAFCLGKLKRHDHASEALSKAIQIDSDDAENFRCRGDLYKEIGKLSESEADYKRATNLASLKEQRMQELVQLWSKTDLGNALVEAGLETTSNLTQSSEQSLQHKETQQFEDEESL